MEVLSQNNPLSNKFVAPPRHQGRNFFFFFYSYLSQMQSTDQRVLTLLLQGQLHVLQVIWYIWERIAVPRN